MLWIGRVGVFLPLLVIVRCTYRWHNVWT